MCDGGIAHTTRRHSVLGICGQKFKKSLDKPKELCYNRYILKKALTKKNGFSAPQRADGWCKSAEADHRL